MNCKLESRLFIGRNWPHTIWYDSLFYTLMSQLEAAQHSSSLNTNVSVYDAVNCRWFFCVIKRLTIQSLVVTIYTTNLTFTNSTSCPHSVFVWLWERTAIISLYSINWFVFITETGGTYSYHYSIKGYAQVEWCAICSLQGAQCLPWPPFIITPVHIHSQAQCVLQYGCLSCRTEC
jgi:hypothetical protein